MKVFLLMSLVLTSSLSFATDGQLGPCQLQAQHAVNSIAKINKLEADANDFILDLASGQSFETGPIVDWISANHQFTVTTKAGPGEKACIVESLVFNPEP